MSFAKSMKQSAALVTVVGSAAGVEGAVFRVVTNGERINTPVSLAEQSATASCPARLLNEDKYEYKTEDWGDRPGTGSRSSSTTGAASERGMQSTACVWAAVCQNAGNDADVDECLSRCPVALGIGGMESNFNPSTFAKDGGFGLWQVGGPSAEAWKISDFADCTKGLHPNLCNKAGDDQSCTCSAYNPIHLAEWVRQATSEGEKFSPEGRCWTTCTGRQCNPVGESSWTSGWVASWASSDNSGGAKAYSMSSAVQNMCKQVIEELYPNKEIKWDSPDVCMKGAPAPAPGPDVSSSLYL